MMYPENYSQWVSCFDVLKAGGNDAETLDCMKKGKLEWSTGVADRFAIQLHEVINARLQKASGRFGRSMQTALGNQNNIVNALLSMRKEYKFLIELCKIPTLPDGYSAKLIELITNQADAAQKSLEDTAKSDRTGMLGSIVRNNRVNNWS